MVTHSTESLSGLLNDRNRRELHALVRTLTQGDASLADDIEQETLAAALQVEAGQIASVSGWLSAVAKNIFRLHLRQKQTGPRFVLLPDETISDGENDPSEICSMDELRGILAKRVKDLPASYQSVINLRIIDGQPPRVVAALLDIPVETVRTRLRRGLDSLRELVATDLELKGHPRPQPLLGLAGLLRMALIPAGAALAIIAVYYLGKQVPDEYTPPALIVGQTEEPTLDGLLAIASAPTEPSLSRTGISGLARVSVEWIAGENDGTTIRPVTVELEGPDGVPRSLTFGSNQLAQVEMLSRGLWTARIDAETVSTQMIGEDDLTWSIVAPGPEGLKVTVFDRQGSPFPGAEVHVQEGLWGRSTLLGVTDDSGALEVAEAPSNAWIGASGPDGLYSESLPVERPGRSRDLQLTLVRTSTQWYDLALPLGLTSAEHQVRSLPIRAADRIDLDNDRGLVGGSDWIPAQQDERGRYLLIAKGKRVIEVLDSQGAVVAIGGIFTQPGQAPTSEGDKIIAHYGVGSVSGRLIDETGLPMPGVDLALVPGEFNGREYFETTTDVEGRFSLEGVPALEWHLKSQLQVLHSFATVGDAAVHSLGDIVTARRVLRVSTTGAGETVKLSFPPYRTHSWSPLLELMGIDGDRQEREFQGGTELQIEQPHRISIPVLYFESRTAESARPLMQLAIRPEGGWDEDPILINMQLAEAAQLRGRIAPQLLPAKAFASEVTSHWSQPLQVDSRTGEVVDGFLPAGNWHVTILDRNGKFHMHTDVLELMPGTDEDIGTIDESGCTIRVEWPLQWVASPREGSIRVQVVDHSYPLDRRYPARVLQKPFIELKLPEGRHRIRLTQGQHTAFVECDARSDRIEVVRARDVIEVDIRTTRAQWKGGDTVLVRALDINGHVVDEAHLAVRHRQVFSHFIGSVEKIEHGTLEVVDPSFEAPYIFDLIPGREVRRLYLDGAHGELSTKPWIAKRLPRGSVESPKKN